MKEKISKSVGYDIEREKKIFSYTSIEDEMILTKGILDSKINNNIQIVLIDYLQLLDVNGNTTKEKIRALRNIAKQKNIVIFVASQISRVFECYNIPPKISAEWLLDKKRIWENFDMADIDKFIFIDRPDRRLSFEEMFAKSCIDVVYSMNTVIVKCYAGMASSACVALEQLFSDIILGSLAGDDTIFAITSGESDSILLTEKIKKLI